MSEGHKSKSEVKRRSVEELSVTEKENILDNFLAVEGDVVTLVTDVTAYLQTPQGQEIETKAKDLLTQVEKLFGWTTGTSAK
jgi:hypothetical protein